MDKPSLKLALYYGIGVPEVQEGDAIAVLFGLDIQFLLQRHSDSPTFVVRAYVSRIMGNVRLSEVMG